MKSKHEWRKSERELYLPKQMPVIVDVPEIQFLRIRGSGNPNKPGFSRYLETLYSIAYGIRMSHKAGFAPPDYFDFTVYPLEGVWDLTEAGRKSYRGTLDKGELVFELMIRQPKFVDHDLFLAAQSRARKKTSNTLINEVELKKFSEGQCVQMLHLGSFDKEPESFEKMQKFCDEHRLLRKTMRHREIYLSDPRKCSEDKLKTVLRIQVSGFAE